MQRKLIALNNKSTRVVHCLRPPRSKIVYVRLTTQRLSVWNSSANLSYTWAVLQVELELYHSVHQASMYNFCWTNVTGHSCPTGFCSHFPSLYFWATIFCKWSMFRYRRYPMKRLYFVWTEVVNSTAFSKSMFWAIEKAIWSLQKSNKGRFVISDQLVNRWRFWNTFLEQDL